jgi:DNA polymerase I-like protein with 3'-5' exonuclease and polymerase domains
VSGNVERPICLILQFPMRWLDGHLILTLHDEIVVEAREDVADQVVGIVAECLQEAFMGIVPEMPFELEMKIAEAWGD